MYTYIDWQVGGEMISVVALKLCMYGREHAHYYYIVPLSRKPGRHENSPCCCSLLPFPVSISLSLSGLADGEKASEASVHF
jgi:hypothetical protein